MGFQRDDGEERVAFIAPLKIGGMSNADLTRAYVLLSDATRIRNVARLAEIEAELRRRNLPIVRSQ